MTRRYFKSLDEHAEVGGVCGAPHLWDGQASRLLRTRDTHDAQPTLLHSHTLLPPPSPMIPLLAPCGLYMYLIDCYTTCRPQVDVCIVGAGSAGLACAYELSKYPDVRVSAACAALHFTKSLVDA